MGTILTLLVELRVTCSIESLSQATTLGICSSGNAGVLEIQTFNSIYLAVSPFNVLSST